MIDVIVPIYNAYEAVKNCLISLSKNSNGINKIYLINDCSTDPKIKSLLDEYISREKWEIINHKRNLGFVKTANEGLKLSDNNTILLNSDTLVTKNWIQAFINLIDNVANLGTATAWSNNAEICSFPETLKNNKIPQNIDQLSEILYENYEPVYPEIPTAVGFCMLVTKQAKDLVGYFDEKHFGHGYGEENDYSLRVKKKGLRNVICDNAYVIHIGNESFSDLGLKPDETTMRRLLEKHPDYSQLIEEYIKTDSTKDIRNNILDIIRQKDKQLYTEIAL